jgi:hypothetical protein
MAGRPRKRVCKGVELVRFDSYALSSRGNLALASARSGIFEDAQSVGICSRAYHFNAVHRNSTIRADVPAEIDQP